MRAPAATSAGPTRLAAPGEAVGWQAGLHPPLRRAALLPPNQPLVRACVLLIPSLAHWCPCCPNIDFTTCVALPSVHAPQGVWQCPRLSRLLLPQGIDGLEPPTLARPYGWPRGRSGCSGCPCSVPWTCCSRHPTARPFPKPLATASCLPIPIASAAAIPAARCAVAGGSQLRPSVTLAQPSACQPQPPACQSQPNHQPQPSACQSQPSACQPGARSPPSTCCCCCCPWWLHHRARHRPFGRRPSG